jgi:hypothetical protein
VYCCLHLYYDVRYEYYMKGLLFKECVILCGVTITSGGDVTGCNLTPVGRGMPRAPVPFFGCGGTPHGRGSSAE